MTHTPHIQLFREQQTEAEIDYPRPERLVNGNPKRTTWNHFTNHSGEVFMGVWACEVGSWQIEMGLGEDEVFRWAEIKVGARLQRCPQASRTAVPVRRSRVPRPSAGTGRCVP